MKGALLRHKHLDIISHSNASQSVPSVSMIFFEKSRCVVNDNLSFENQTGDQQLRINWQPGPYMTIVHV